VPVRSALGGAVFGILGIVAVLVFASSLDRLTTTPRLYGWSWGVLVPGSLATPTGESSCTGVQTGLMRDPDIAALAVVCIANVEVDGRPITGWGFTHLRGAIDPTIVAGRAPRGPDEVALGASTLTALRKHVGDTVVVRGQTPAVRYRVVGRVLMPSLTDPQPLSDGTTFTGAGLTRLLKPDSGPDFDVLARLAPGADRA